MEREQINEIRQNLIGRIRSAVTKNDGCIGTFYKNVGRHHTEEKIEEEHDDPPIVVTHNTDISFYGNYEAATLYDLFIDKKDSRLKCTLNGEAGEDWDEPIENIQTEGLLNVIEWLAQNGFIENERPESWHCSSCGSTNLKRLIWADPNNNYKFIAEDESINYRSVCRHCGAETLFVKHSELMADIDYWFENDLGPDDPEVISGLNFEDFATEDEYDAACKKLWDARSAEEKIEIWNTLTNRSEE